MNLSSIGTYLEWQQSRMPDAFDSTARGWPGRSPHPRRSPRPLGGSRGPRRGRSSAGTGPGRCTSQRPWGRRPCTRLQLPQRPRKGCCGHEDLALTTRAGADSDGGGDGEDGGGGGCPYPAGLEGDEPWSSLC